MNAMRGCRGREKLVDAFVRMRGSKWPDGVAWSFVVRATCLTAFLQTQPRVASAAGCGGARQREACGCIRENAWEQVVGWGGLVFCRAGDVSDRVFTNAATSGFCGGVWGRGREELVDAFVRMRGSKWPDGVAWSVVVRATCLTAFLQTQPRAASAAGCGGEAERSLWMHS